MPDSPLKSPTVETPPTLEYAPPRPGWKDRFEDWVPSKEQTANFLKNLVWVAPLTLLIWIYAEREETVKVTLPAFPVVVKTTAPDRVVDLRYPQDHNIVVELSGPRARVDYVREALAGKPLELVIDPQLRLGGSQLSAAAQLNNHPLFKNNGVTVKGCLPTSFSVDIDQLETREAVVKASEESAPLVEFASFQPDRVKIRAPSHLLEKAPKDGGELFVFADFSARSELKARTGKIELDNVPVRWFNYREHVSLSPQTVHASLSLKQSDAQHTIPSVGIFKMNPRSLDEKFKVDYTATIQNVTVIGPPDLIEMVKKDPSKVSARLAVKEGTPDQAIMGQLFFDLPPGLKLAPGTPDKWEYRLSER